MNKPAVYITDHALQRYRERFGGNGSPKSVEKRANAMRRAAAFGMKIKPKDALKTYLFNKCTDVDYILYRNVVVVVESHRVVTAYGYVASEWEPI